MTITAFHPTPRGATIYYWQNGLLLLAETLVLNRPTRPIAATLRIALRNKYTIEVEDKVLVTHASIVAAKRLRKRIIAMESDIALFYFPIERPEYAGLRKRLSSEAVVELNRQDFEPVIPRLHLALQGALLGPEVKELAVETLRIVAGPMELCDEIDPRIQCACELLAHMPLNEFRIEDMATRLNLSPSRLRSLFKQQIGHAIGEYARWSAIWQSVALWQPQRTFTDAVLDAGFFDLAHGVKTFVEVFGMSPTLATDSSFVRLVHCE